MVGETLGTNKTKRRVTTGSRGSSCLIGRERHNWQNLREEAERKPRSRDIFWAMPGSS
jgi:hypothetical protein